MKQLSIISILLIFVLQEVRTEDTMFNLLSRLLHERNWLNEMDGNLDFSCAEGHALKKLESEHDNHYEDRKWKMNCGLPGMVSNDCKWHKLSKLSDTYVGALMRTSKLAKKFTFNCPDNGAITGVRGDHVNTEEDRKYEFRCCSATGSLQGCKMTGYKNDYDMPLSYEAPSGQVIKGITSDFAWWYADRRFDFNVCSMG